MEPPTLRQLGALALTFLPALPSAAQDAAPAASTPAEYRAQSGDSMWMVAMMFYGTPGAWVTLVEANLEVLTETWERNVAADPALRAKYPRPEDYLALDQAIQLPVEIWAGALLVRRYATPIPRPIARRLGRSVDLPELRDLAQELGMVKEPPAFSPLPYAVVTTDLPSRPSTRPAPPWFSAPTTVLQRCAVALCGHYRSLAPTDCLILARRMADAGWSDGEIASRCTGSLPAQLPFDIEVSHAN